jgi:hypothetical protein
MIMATFAAWLSEQQDRQDAVGYLARYWHQASPGRLSAVSGVEKHLRAIEADYRTRPDGMEEPAWQQGQAAIAAALNGFRFAVEEYHKMQAAEVAQAHGVPLAETPKLSIVTDIPPQHAQAGDPEHPSQASARYTGWPEARFDRMEQMLSTLIAQNEAIIKAITFLLAEPGEPDPIDWDALFTMADHTAEVAP